MADDPKYEPDGGEYGDPKDRPTNGAPSPEEALEHVVRLVQAIIPNALELWQIYRGFQDAQRSALESAENERARDLGAFWDDREPSADRWEFYWTCNGQGKIVTPPGEGWLLSAYKFNTIEPDALGLHLLWKRRLLGPGPRN